MTHLGSGHVRPIANASSRRGSCAAQIVACNRFLSEHASLSQHTDRLVQHSRIASLMCHLHAVEDIRRSAIESLVVAESLLKGLHE
jgi:hypothetical protein